MKKKLLLFSILFLLICLRIDAQEFWTETFGGGCSTGQLANIAATPTNGAWSITSLNSPFLNGTDANEWYISATENGNLEMACSGNSCGSNRTLHIGVNQVLPIFVDAGANYLTGSANKTNKRVESPIIDFTGRKFVQLSFLYFVGGVVGSDFCDIEYSLNGGVTWNQFATLPIPGSSFCIPGTTEWRFYTIGLPSTLSNIPNVKIGFHWYNNNLSGTDISVAIDWIGLSELTINTNTLVNCLTANSTASIVNNATANSSYTWSSIPNTVTFTPLTGSATSMQYPGPGTFTIFAKGSRYINGAATSTAASVVNVGFINSPMVTASSSQSLICTGSTATLTASGANSYTWSLGPNSSNYVISPSVTSIYSVTGTDGYCTSTFTLQQMVEPCTGINEQVNTPEELIYPNPFNNEINITSKEEVDVTIYSSIGQLVKQIKFKDKTVIHTSELPKGVYMLFVKGQSGAQSYKVVKN